MIVYLCGPINGCSDAEAKDWREHVKGRYTQHGYLDPMARDFRGHENDPGIDVEIVEGDLEDIANSDVLLVSYDKPSVGTSMEIVYAKQQGKLIIVVARPETAISPWLRYHAHAIVPSYAEAMSLIDQADETRTKQERIIEQIFDAMDEAWQRIFPGAKFDR